MTGQGWLKCPASARQREHGGLWHAELQALGIAPESVADFSVNTLPYGPSERVLEAVRRARIDAYPDPQATLARSALSAAIDVPLESIALGNGAADLLWTLARALIRPGMSALIVEPTFSEFRSAVAAMHAPVHEWRAGPERDFSVCLPAVAEQLRRTSAQVLYLCNPGTPSGAGLEVGAIARFAASFRDTWIVLDESFLSLSERAADAAVPVPSNVIRVRSLTKDQSVPGVRVGYLVGSPQLVAMVERARPAWSSSAAAQAIASVVAENAEFVAASCRRWLAAREWVARQLMSAGYRALPSCTGFFMVDVGDAHAFRRRLLIEHRILVRNCASFALPAFVRIGVRTDEENRRLVSALVQEARKR